MKPLVSVITCALNQGDWVRKTIPGIKESLGDYSNEIIVVDDQSVDGCCHGLDQDILVMRTHARYGVSASRRLAARTAQGEVLLFTDPHCHYPGYALRDYVSDALEKRAIVCASTTSRPAVRKTRYGGVLTASDRGLKVSYAKKGPAEFPSLLGTIYAVERGIYDHIGGWPELPGVWGTSEQAFTLASWFAGVPIYINTDHVCNHEHYHPAEGTKFSYRVPGKHHAQNAHWVHACFFPDTYEHHWKPILENRFKKKESNVECFKGRGWGSKDPDVGRRTLKEERLAIQRRSIRTEEDFYQLVLGIDKPLYAKPAEQSFIDQQRKRSQPKDSKDYYEKDTTKQDRSIRWFIKHVPGCIKGLKIVDLGCRSGYVVEQLLEYGLGKVQGVEVVPETAEWAKNTLGRNVITGDMRNTPYQDNYWHRTICMHALEHVPDPERVLEEMHRITIPGGWIFIVVPLEARLHPRGRFAHNYCFKTEQDLIDLVEKYPFEKITCEKLRLPRQDKEIYEALLVAKKPPGARHEVKRQSKPHPKVDGKYVEQQRERCKVDDDFRKWNWRQKRAVSWFLEQAPEAVDKKHVLDIGTRDGWMTKHIKNLGAVRCRGVELVPEVAAWAKEKLGRDVITADMQSLPFRDGKWDCCLCVHVLEHLPDPSAGLREMLRVLKPGGWFLINVPRERKLNRHAAHNTFFDSMDKLLALFYNKEVEVTHHEEVYSLPPKDGIQPERKELLLMGRKK